jgi:hypothetical protein
MLDPSLHGRPWSGQPQGVLQVNSDKISSESNEELSLEGDPKLMFFMSPLFCINNDPSKPI